jgi:predicted transcriptional regulator
MIKVLGNIRNFEQGDLVQMGPTPVNRLVVRGEIVGRDDTGNTLVFSINEMISLPKKPVRYYSNKNVITINVNNSIKEAATLLSQNNIYGAPVEDNGNIVGTITLKDIGRVISKGDMDIKVKDVMKTDLITIDSEASLIDAVKIFDANPIIAFIIVTYDGVAKSILSKTDVLHELAVY